MRRRPVRPAARTVVAVAAALAAVAGVAEWMPAHRVAIAGTEPCGPAGPLPVTVSVYPGETAEGGIYLDVSWPATYHASVSAPGLAHFVGEDDVFRVERREGAGDGNGWEFRASVRQPNAGGSGYRDYIPPAERGRTYSYRVRYAYAYGSDCLLDDGYVRHESVWSDVKSIDAPPYVPKGGARNVVAVANTKKPQVRLTWDLPESGVEPPAWEIERRVTGGGGAGKAGARAGETGVFETIAQVTGGVLAFLDRSADRDRDYEYRVVSATGGTRIPSAADAAYTVGNYALAPIDLWSGQWELEDASLAGTLGSVSLSIEPRRSDGAILRADVRGGLTYEPRAGNAHADLFRAVDAAGDVPDTDFPVTGRGAASKPSWKCAIERTDIGGRLPLDPETEPVPDVLVPSWLAEVPSGSPGRLVVSLSKSPDPFDPMAFRRMTAAVRLGSLRLKFDGNLDDHYVDAAEVLVAATVGAGRSSARPGEIVAVVWDCASLGPGPLYAGLVAVDLSIDNGRIAAVKGGAFVRPAHADPAGLDIERFHVGALGADARSLSRRARLVVFVEVLDPGDDGQVRCTFTLNKEPADARFVGGGISFAHSKRVVEIAVPVPAPATKR